MLRRKNTVQSGFSIPEIMIVVTFFAIMSSIVLFNYRDFDDSAQLDNEALSVALEIRDMQVRALSARNAGPGIIDPDAFRYAYGVFFDRTVSTSSFLTYINSSATNPTYYWFDGNFMNCDNECIFRHKLSDGYQISKICTSASVCSETDASVSFKRPDPDAIIKTSAGGADLGELHVEIMSPKGATSTVHVTKTGQIYVK